MQSHTKRVLKDIGNETKVKGAGTVAEELGISEEAVRELASMTVTNYRKQMLTDIDLEAKVKGARMVAEELEVSERAVRELAPR